MDGLTLFLLVLGCFWSYVMGRWGVIDKMEKVMKSRDDWYKLARGWEQMAEKWRGHSTELEAALTDVILRLKSLGDVQE